MTVWEDTGDGWYKPREYRFETPGGLSLMLLASNVYDDLRAVRQRIGPKRIAKRRNGITRYTKTTHKRNRAKVSAQRKANVRRLQSQEQR